MSEQDNRSGGSLVPAGWRDLATVSAAHSLVSRGIADLTRFRSCELGEPMSATPVDAQVCCDRGTTWLDAGEYDKAIRDFDEAIRLDPKLAAAYDGRGIAWLGKMEYDKAIEDLKEGIRLDPNYTARLPIGGRDLPYAVENVRSSAWFWLLCRACYSSYKEDYDRALRHFNVYIHTYPTDLPFWHRGRMYFDKGDYEKAIQDFERSIRLGGFAAAADLAWLLATCPVRELRDRRRAIQLAAQACEHTQWEGEEELSVLAAACAEGGQFDKAVHYQTKALECYELSRSNSYPKMVWRMHYQTKVLECHEGPALDEARRRLELYKLKEPYRDST